MAEKQAGGLSLKIGLTLSQLQSDFLAAEQTVKQGIAALNRQQNLIKLRMEADTAGLDVVVDKTRILEIQERSLTQLLEMQRDKLTLATKAYQEYANSKNANEVVAKKLETSMERERLAVVRLEAQLKSLSAQKVSIDTSQLQNKISQLDGKIKNVRLKAEIDVSQLKEAGNIFDAQKVHISAVTKELELQRQKLIQLRESMYQSAKNTGGDSFQTINIKTNVLEQMRQISLLETKLKSLQNNNINLQIRADSIKQVEQTISDNIARINAKIEHIKVKTDIDVSKLGAAASEFDKAKAHVQGLNRELDLQNKKLLELKNALRNSISTNGLNNVKTINLQTEIQKQIQAIDQLKAKINELNKIEPPKTNGLLSGYLNIKGDVTGKLNSMALAFSQLKGATSSADSAITSTLGVIDSIPHPVGRAVAALVSLPLIFKGIENSIIDMTRQAAVSGDAVYVMSRGMQMSLKDAGKFSTNAKVAGTEVNSLKMAIQQVQRQIVKGGDDSRAAEWLKRYGESARDANGNLKNLNDMTFALSRALHKAQEEGKGAEFVFSVFRNISADDITAIEDWISVNEQAATIVKNGLANPALAHEVKGNLNALAVQEGQLKASFESALLPVANEIVPRITERMGKLTQVIADNKDVIKELGNDLASIWGGVETVVDKIGDGVGVIGGVIKDVYMAKANAANRLVERYKNDTNVKTAEDLLQRELSRGYTPQDRAAIEATPYLYEQELKKYEPVIKAIQDAREEIKKEKKALSDEIASVAEISSVAADRRAVEENPELLKQAESLKKILQETSDIQYKLSHTDYENKKLDVLQWQQDILNQAEMTEEKRVAIEKLGAAKLAQIEQERADKLAEIRASIEAADKTALQNKLDNIEKERQAWLKAGMDEAESVELAQKKIAKAYEEANAKIKEHYQNAADIEYEMTHSAFEKQIRDIERWEELQKRKAESVEESAAIGAEAVAKEARAFEQEMDRIKGTIQSLEDKIFEQEHSQYENDLRRIQQERLKYYQDYQKQGILNLDTQALIERYYQNAIGKLNKRAAESRTKGGDYTKAPEGAGQFGGNGIMVIGANQIVDNGLIRGQQRQIALLTDENRIRTQLMTKLDESARAEVEKINATKALTEAQADLTQQMSSNAIVNNQYPGVPVVDAPTIIQGDQVTQISNDDAKKIIEEYRRTHPQQALSDYQQMPNEQLQQFGDALQQTTADIQQIDPLQEFKAKLQEVTNTQSAFISGVKDFPPDYFKTLADNAKSVSEMQGLLTRSTMDLIKAQGSLADTLNNLPSVNPAKQTNNNQSLPTDSGFVQLSNSTQNVKQEQDLLARSSREASDNLRQISDIPARSQSDSGMKFGFDMDMAGLVAGLGSLALMGASAPISAPVLGGVAITSLLAGLAKGSYDETTAPRDYDERLKAMPDIDLSALETSLNDIKANVQSLSEKLQVEKVPLEINLSELVTPLSSIDEKTQSILQAIQDQRTQGADRLQELFGTLPNIEELNKSILLEMQEEKEANYAEYLSVVPKISEDVQSILQSLAKPLDVPEAVTNRQMPELSQDTIDYLSPLNSISGKLDSVIQEMQKPMTFETVVTPLNSITTLVDGISKSLSNRQPPQININPNNNIDLGGAYVFDNALKKQLVDDITSQIVDRITSAVNQATRNASYSYGA